MASQRDPQLRTYRDKRDPTSTPEPFGRVHIPATGKLFVVQQHDARHLHFDLRLEVDGVLKSWAVPKGPSDDPADKRFAVETEDHPLDYADFEGEIPPGNYGAGHVIVWDRGWFEFKEPFDSGMQRGKLLFEIHGYKMRGLWTLVRLKKSDSGKEWLLIKERDGQQSTSGCTFSDTSILSGLSVKQLKKPGGKLAAISRALQRVNPSQSVPLADITCKPMLASSGEAGNRSGWIWELKYDGYRIMARKDGGDVRLITRNGHNIADSFPEICQTLHHLPQEKLILDGELVVNDASGRPSFARMQARARNTARANRAAIEEPATYYAFDLLYLQTQDLRDAPLLARKRLLKQVLPTPGALVYSEHVEEEGEQTYAWAKRMGIEGVVGKKADSPYRSGRSQSWIKVRSQRVGDFVVAGWSGSRSNPRDIGALALAEYRAGTLTYAGHAGSGLSGALRNRLQASLKRLARKTCPLETLPETTRETHWLTPKLVVEVSFTEYTPYGHLRHPSISRLREDKTPEECLSAFDTVESTQPTPQPDVQVVVTNPEKVFYPEPGYTKADLVQYYRRIARWMLPYLKDRPVVLTRFPDGIDGKSFYQRDIPDYVPDWIRRETLWSESTGKEVQYVVPASEEDLAYLANMGTIPIHMWHSRITDLSHPDWCVLDLDPKKAPFSDVINLGLAIRDLCHEVKLPSYPKTSGASGLHVLIPLHGQLTHDQSQTLGELLARVIVNRHPDIATITRTVRARNNKVYVDYLQNGHGRLIVAPFSARAESAGSVSMPLKWREVNAGLSNPRFHLGNAVRRMQRLKADPGAAVLSDKPDLLPSLERLAELLA